MTNFLNFLEEVGPMPNYVEINILDEITRKFNEWLLFIQSEQFWILIGIATIFPAIICLLIAYFASKDHEGSGKSVLGLIGVGFIMVIPIVSTVMTFVWAFGEKTKSDPTFRNWARLLLISHLYTIIFYVTYVVATMLLLA